MIGNTFKKYALEKGMKVSSGVAYGSLGGFAATLSEGSGYKSIVFTTKFADAAKKQELMNEVGTHNLYKEFRVQKLDFAFDAVVVIFHDNPGTMKKLTSFVEWFCPLLEKYGAGAYNVCTHCGMEIENENWIYINGVAYNLHNSCADKIAADAETEAEMEKEEKKGSYIGGFIGALVGGLVGAIPWAIVLLLGYMASVLGVLIGWLADKGYNLLGGKKGKGKVVILAIAAIVGVVVGTFAADVITLVQMINSGELAGLPYGDIPYVILTLLIEDSEYLRVTLGNIGMGLLFAFLGEWFFLKRAAKESKGFSMKKLG
ncbi:MAG: hypothetical protein IKV79_02815 [Oscillospiraceae bacterium]|nr:hypothetical protein [Oscillospiraceae bacterium]